MNNQKWWHTTKAIENYNGYDYQVALAHMENYGCIIVDNDYNMPIDNEFELEEIIAHGVI